MKRQCSVPGCESPHLARGKCNKHYKWLKKKPGYLIVDGLPTRVWDKIKKTETCWLWTGAIGRATGYGRTSDGNGKVRDAHRWIWEQLRGAVPEGLELDHLCRVRHCVNPDHLEPVTPRENTLRGVGASAINARKTRCPKGHLYDMTVRRTSRAAPDRACSECRRAAALRSSARTHDTKEDQ